jgi:hypothetical protein
MSMAYIIGMNLTQVRTNALGAEFKLGTIGMTSDGKMYKYVQYNAGAGTIAAVAGNVVGYFAPAGDFAAEGYTNNKVTSDVSDALVAAGVLQAVIADTGYGWIQIRGAATLTTALVSGADGNTLVLSTTTDGTMKVAAAVTDITGAIAQDISDKTIICNFPM